MLGEAMSIFGAQDVGAVGELAGLHALEESRFSVTLRLR